MNQLNRFFMVMIIGCTSLFTNNIMAQRPGSNVIVSSTELLDNFNNNDPNALQRGFCHDITVTVGIFFVEVQTTITICCSTNPYICIPLIRNRILDPKGKYPTHVEVSNSTSIVQGDYQISILTGRYQLNKEGELTNLKFILTQI